MSVFIRADGSRTIGLGHLMRCHALAQEARRRGHSVCFLSRPLDRTGISKLRALGESVLPLTGPEDSASDLAATLGALGLALRSGPPDRPILVTDHNGVDTAWLRGAREAGHVVVSLNDLPRIHYASHLVVNGNPGAEKLLYETEQGVRLLLGPDYFLFRDEFITPGLARTDQPQNARHVVVTLGAGDPENVTQQVLEALEGTRKTLEITLVAGAAYGHLASLEVAAARSRHRVTIEHDPPSPTRVFAPADLAVCAGGSTACEMAILGVPAVVLILSETQADPARALDNEGVARCEGSPHSSRILEAVESLLADPKRRRDMSERGRRLFDGLGRERVLREAETVVMETMGSPGDR